MRELKHGPIGEENVHGLILVSVRHKASRYEMKCVVAIRHQIRW